MDIKKLETILIVLMTLSFSFGGYLSSSIPYLQNSNMFNYQILSYQTNLCLPYFSINHLGEGNSCLEEVNTKYIEFNKELERYNKKILNNFIISDILYLIGLVLSMILLIIIVYQQRPVIRVIEDAKINTKTEK